jgi:FkbM family methyltransferase
MNPAAGFGWLRSFLIYGAFWRQPGLRRFYRPFIRPGDRVFDIGAHLGDRSLAFAALGGRVVACEPQSICQRYLRWRLRRHPDVEVLQLAVAEAPGEASLAISDRHPTLATISHEWRDRARRAGGGFSQVRWNQHETVRVVTLAQLIERYGVPGFCKIDVEGAEPSVLAGLDQPVPMLSFEYLAGHRAAVQQCLQHLQRLGRYRFNVTRGERRRLEFQRWVGDTELLAWLADNADDAGSGDIYARQVD